MAQEIFEAKLRTGLYNHYTESALKILRDDCIRQAELIERSMKCEIQDLYRKAR